MSITIESLHPLEIFVKFVTENPDLSNFVNISPNKTATIKIEEGIYDMQFNFFEAPGSLNFKVTSPGFYYINQFMDMYTKEGDYVTKRYQNITEKNPEISDLKAEPNQIIVKNVSEFFERKVRISAHGGGSEDFVLLAPLEHHIWERNQGSNCHLEVSLNSVGPTYNVKPGMAYMINNDYDLVDCEGHDLPFSMDHFRSFYEENKEITESSDDSDSDLNNQIIVNNMNETNISVRVQKDSSSTDDYFLIKTGQEEIFKRKNGKYMIEICTENNNMKFYVETKSKYYFNSHLLFNGSKDFAMIDPTSDKFETKSNSKPQQLGTTEEIVIKNLQKFLIHARVQSKGKGTEDLFIINPDGGSQKWSRKEGRYLIEITSSNFKKFMYYVNTSNVYVFTKDYLLLKENSDLHISQTSDNTFGPSWLDDDETTGEDDFEKEDEGNSKNCDNVNEFNEEMKENFEEKNSNNNLKENDIYDNKYGNEIQENLKNQKQQKYSVPVKDPFSSNNQNVPYFNNVKPNYTPSVLFTDETFPPDDKTINSVNRLTGEKIETHLFHGYSRISYPDTSHFVFKRPKQIWGKKYALFKDEIEPNDVKQGEIGNCYLVSVLASLARRPELIERLFKTRSVNNDGFYEIYYFEKNGEKRIMFLDDHLLRVGDQKFFSAQPNGQELWVLLLEKCYAKYEGGYSNIDGGVSSEAFQFFTGAVVRNYKEEKIANCWDELVSAINKGHICCASSLQSEDNTDKHKSPDGIIFSHAYSLINAKEYNNGKIRIRLVELRNPHATGEWKGSFSDESPDWTPELEAYFNLDEALGENGIFWMPFEKFTQLFDQVTICYC